MRSQSSLRDGVDTIAKVATWAADEYGSTVALTENEVRVSFADYVARARDVAASLIARGIAKGDRVALWAPNSIGFATCALGVQLAGAVLVPINTRFRAREAAHVLSTCQPKLLFTVDSFLGVSYLQLLEELCAEDPDALSAVPDTVLIDEGNSSLEIFLQTASGQDAVARRMDGIEPDDIAVVLFTSGTTGRPKGAMLAHGPLVRGYREWSSIIGLRPGDRILVSNPFFHAFGLMVGLLSALIHGANVYPLVVFSADEALAMVEQERITYYPGPPTVFYGMLASPRFATSDLSSLRMCVVGATSIPPMLIDDLFDQFGFAEVFVPYGFTEGTGLATITRPSADRELIKATAGQVLSDIELQIWDEQGAQVNVEDEVGEIVLRGYNVMPGYLDASTGRPSPADRDQWLRSGDLGSLDRHGNLTVRGRLTDLIIVGGFNVYPAEVESYLLNHPDVENTSVVGVEDPTFGEVPVAFVVLTPDSSLTAEDLRTWCSAQVANFKTPRQFHFVSELPMNASGKVLKTELQAKASAERGDSPRGISRSNESPGTLSPHFNGRRTQ